jgi:hypothetical protein
MALSNCAAQRSGETATTNGHVLGVDLPLFKFGLLTDIQHADKVRLHRRGRKGCLMLLCSSTLTAAAVLLHSALFLHHLTFMHVYGYIVTTGNGSVRWKASEVP